MEPEIEMTYQVNVLIAAALPVIPVALVAIACSVYGFFKFRD